MAIAFVASLATNAQSSHENQLIRSKPVDDLVQEVWLRKTLGILYSTSYIRYDWLTLSNQQMAVYLPTAEYACFAQMFNSASNAISLRWSFRNLGKHFFDLKYPSIEQPWNAIKKTISIRPAHGTQAAAADFVIASLDFGGGQSFYNLEDLFQMKRPGRYTVRLQFQAYERIYKGGQNFAFKLERFDPVEFSVTKQ